MSLSLASAAAETTPGSDSPCTRGRSVLANELSNGDAQYSIVLCCVAVVTGETTSMPKKRFCRELKRNRISDLPLCEADSGFIYRHGGAHTHGHNDRLTMKGAERFHVLYAVAFFVSPYLLFSVNLKIAPFLSSVKSHTSVDQIQIPAVPFKLPKLHIFKTTLPYLQRVVQPYTFITLLPTLWPLLANSPRKTQCWSDSCTSEMDTLSFELKTGGSCLHIVVVCTPSASPDI